MRATRQWSVAVSVFALVAVAIALSACTREQSQTARIFISPAVFDLGDGKFEFVERGYLFVPENRDNPDSATIGIHFMRFRSTSDRPATPIFITPGGPGSAWIPDFTEGTKGVGDPAKGNFEIMLQILADLRSVADVVVTDQRGAGQSIPQMDCPNHQRLAPVDTLHSPNQVMASYKQFVQECKQAWTAQGRDLDGYRAVQLADDIDDLRRELGYEKISLWGGSFGSEWGFVTLRRHPQIVERVVFHGLEGINHTYDSPTGILTSIKAILAQAETDPDLAPHVPNGGILQALRSRIEELAAKPVTVAAADPITGESLQVLIGADELRQAWRAPVNRLGPQAWPASVVPILNGDLRAAATQVAKNKSYYNPRPTGNRSAMHLPIDCGLSPTAERRQQLASDPAIELIGNINLMYFGICDAWQAPNIQADWLKPLQTDIPALFFHGTWDLSTPLENATEIAAGFSNGHLLVVDGGTHGIILDLYREQPETIRPLMRRFLSGQPIDGAPKRVSLPPVDFLGPANR